MKPPQHRPRWTCTTPEPPWRPQDGACFVEPVEPPYRPKHLSGLLWVALGALLGSLLMWGLGH